MSRCDSSLLPAVSLLLPAPGIAVSPLAVTAAPPRRHTRAAHSGSLRTGCLSQRCSLLLHYPYLQGQERVSREAGFGELVS